MSVAYTISIAPGWVFGFVTTVVETILGFGRAMEINDDLQAGFASPVDGSVEVYRRTLGIRSPRFYVAPVS
ncbi:predicted protein [Plenodomus lingam JN3]|uniref:Predicted protein n=1 Tax=Leptosphaeria maculans (strain JN3 / isolate v23.1.3 / race Av1-4-5-6-7-8) TaxID=985895 RepID=E4ZJB0_LEPMJ|nr:predicted protein [Plenodomus lingam JN3]CBX91541.1 predicted protein [Plenodomus lingam JN3]